MKGVVRMAMNNYIFAISRGYGSGGRCIGEKLAETLNIPLIDRELLQIASVESGISEEIFNLADEKVRHRFFERKEKKYHIGILMNPENEGFTSEENLFNYQSKVLLNMAMKTSFVVIGRASTYVLRTFPNVISVNIQAPFDDCVDAIMKSKGVSEKQAMKDIKTIDKYRREYHKYYTKEEWCEIDNYDLFLNSSRIGRAECVELIIHYAEKKLNKSLR